ncbi:hypothetical protein JVU11DRAFT_9216 [Chiua virens]|nr:hypothetical protein JVU11DRAFT_9216 [Chiua virens]
MATHDPSSNIPATADTNPPAFSLGKLTSVLDSGLATGYSDNQQLALACTLLRLNTHLDGQYYQTHTQAGLHPWYVGLHPVTTPTVQSKNELLRAAHGDLFDAITTQDCLDGGLSILIHCPGTQATQMLSFDRISLDVYVTPREFALPHLHHYTKHCRVEAVTPIVHRFLGSSIGVTGLQHLPPPIEAPSSHLQCSVLSPEAFINSTIMPTIWSNLCDAVNNNQILPTNLPQTPTSVHRHHPADVFELAKPTKLDTKPHNNHDSVVEPVIESILKLVRLEKFTLPLISIGAHLDSVLDQLGLEDTCLLCLHALCGSVQSSHWVTRLAGPEWNLHSDQAAALTSALLKDVHGTQDYTINVVKVHFCRKFSAVP